MAVSRFAYLPIELKSREFAGQVTLANQLIRSGFEVYLGSYAAILNLLETKTSKGGIFFERGVQNDKLLEFIKVKVNFIFFCDTELSPILDSKEDKNEALTSKIELSRIAIDARLTNQMVPFIDAYFTIGEPYTSIAKTILPAEIVHETGWPRFDLLSELGKRSFADQVERIFKRYDTFVLYAVNFSISKKVERVRGTKYEELLLPGHFSEEEHARDYFDARECLKTISYWRDQGFTTPIVIRTHPGESIRPWKKLVKELSLKDVHVDNRFEVFPWLFACSALLHRGSTTAIQAKLIGKPVFFMSRGDSRGWNNKARKISDSLIDLDFKELKAAINGRWSPSGDKSELLSLSEKIGKASVLIAQIAKSYSERVSLETRVSVFQFLKGHLRISKVRRLLGLVRDEILFLLGYLPVLPQSRNYPGGISAQEVKSLLKKQGVHNVKVRTIGVNLVHLSEVKIVSSEIAQ